MQSMMMWDDALTGALLWPLGLALTLALALRPWRMLRDGALTAPLLACLVLLPWFWAFPRLYPGPLNIQISGACLVLLMLGWPLAVPVLLAVAALSAIIAPAEPGVVLAQVLWNGIVPATFALALGAAVRRWLPRHIFVYILGRAFIGTALCMFLAGAASHWFGWRVPRQGTEISYVALWLIAWGDAFLTGMLTAIFVAFRPGWMATWSDRLYLRPPGR